MELSKRIEYILKNNPVKPGISITDFAASVYAHRTKIHDLKSGKVKTLDAQLAFEISTKYMVNPKFLAKGEGKPFLDVPESIIADANTQEKRKDQWYGFGQRLKQIRESQEIRSGDFAEILGIDHLKLLRTEDRETEPPIEIIPAIIIKTNININYLFTGEGNLFKTDKQDLQIYTEEQYYYKAIPLRKSFSELGNMEDLEETEHVLIDGITFEEINAELEDCDIMIADFDESMQPTIKSKDKVLIDRSKTTIQDGKVFIIEVEGSFLIKRLQKLPGNKIKVISDNKEYESYILTADDNYKIIGQVLWVSKKEN